MGARLFPAADDPIGPVESNPIEITVNGLRVQGVLGQTLAGVLLSSDMVSWRSTPSGNRPRGAFCAIGVCFDCLIIVNGQRDVRACQRRAAAGDVVALDRDPPRHAVREAS